MCTKKVMISIPNHSYDSSQHSQDQT